MVWFWIKPPDSGSACFNHTHESLAVSAINVDDVFFFFLLRQMETKCHQVSTKKKKHQFLVGIQ